MTSQLPGQKKATWPASGQIQINNGGAVNTFLAQAAGTVVMNGATPVAVVDAGVTASSIILLTLKTVGGTVSPTLPNVVTITPGTGFSVAGVALDTSTYNWVRIG